jgi:hypothetical protein
METRGRESGRLPMVILEHTAQPFAADNFPGLLVRFGPWQQDLMVQPLMRTFPVIMDYVLVHGLTQRGLAEQDDSCQRFVFERSEEAFQVGVAIRTLRWQQHRLHVGSRQNGLELRREFRARSMST